MEKQSLSNDIINHFRLFFFDEESVDSFIKWLYASKEIEQAIGYENYYSLLEIDYRQPDNVYTAKQIVKKIYEKDKQGKLVIDQGISIAENILNGSIGLHDGCRKLADLCLADLCSDRNEYIDRVFVAYVDELDRLEDTNFYDDRIMDDVKKLLTSYGRESGSSGNT
ncbi:hypothetical protein [Methylovulum miyakonense]|uniref:hypothetical protein n=1 Tax=Methylovulum miyakonense TaxID=645578 RepID=UPI000378955A|nr:hypothetical protein [Methylovulum miyakonense]